MLSWAAALRARTIGNGSLFIKWGRGGRRYITIHSRWADTTARLLVEHQGSGTTLKTWVSSLAGPISFTRLTQGYIGVGIILAERMFLATLNILGPVTGVSFFVVK